MKKRIGYIDSLKGLAILLMVMGHVIAWQFSDWQFALNSAPRIATVVWRIIYSFHMPLLMFCAGLFALNVKEYTWQAVGKTLWKRISSLLIPFFFAGLVLNIIKPNQPFNYWFLWMLFQFIVVVLAIDGLCSILPKYGEVVSTIMIIGLALIVQVYYPRFLHLQRLPLIDIGHWRQFPYFCMGVVCARHDLCSKWFSRNYVFTCALLVFGFLTYWLTIEGHRFPHQDIIWCLLPISAIVVLVYIFKEGLADSHFCGLTWLQNIGHHSLEIYIIHFFFLFRMPIIGDFVLEQANTIGGGRTIFVAQAVSSFVASIIIIILSYIVMNVINKSKILSPLLLGRKSEFI